MRRVVVVIIILAAAILMGFYIFRKLNFENSTVNSSDLESWVGYYSFSEFAPPDQNMFYGISIYKGTDGYYAEIGIDGFQTIKRVRAKVLGDKNRIRLSFYQYLPDNRFEPYKEGDILLSFEKSGSEIYTFWGEIEAMLLENESGNIYFRKDEK